MGTLVRVSTADGVRLDGAVIPQPDARAVAILIHGTGSNFYGSALFDALTPMLQEAGLTVLRVNTRGHDLVSTDGGRRFGAAYERVEDCRHDLSAWVNLAATHSPRVLLIGHSLGAVKSLYAQAHEPHPAVVGVAAISPPRLAYSWFVQHAPVFIDTYQQAKALNDSGEGQTLLDVRFPMSFLCTAEGYVEKYGPEERYDYLKALGLISVPMLVTLGEKEMIGNPAFHVADESIRSRLPTVPVEVIPGADHNYNGTRAALGRILTRWGKEVVDGRRSDPT